MDELKKRIMYLYDNKVAPGTYKVNVATRTFTFLVDTRGLTISENSGGDTFRIYGMYSGDRKKCAFDNVRITEEADRCFRIALGKGASTNPRAEAEAILRAMEPASDPFGPPAPGTGDPFSVGAPSDPFGSGPASAPSADLMEEGWADIDIVVPTTNNDINASLFDKEGVHALRPAQFQNLLEYLPLTVNDAAAIVGIARRNATSERLMENIKIAGGVMKGSAKSWSKGCFHAAISSAQNDNRDTYDYFATSTAFLNAAAEHYGKIARFTVVPSK